MKNYLPIARATLPFTSSKDQFVAKKKKIFPSENLATIDTTSSPEAKIDKVKPRRASTRARKVAPSKKGTRKTRSSVAAAATPGPTDEEICIRAYFISERRRRCGLPGDANSDWIEAKRHLLSEIGPR